MILVGIPVHEESLNHLNEVLAIWNGTEYDCRVLVVYNGRLSPSSYETLKRLQMLYRGSITTFIIRPNAHLYGYGPLRQAQELMRYSVLSGNYTHLLFNEVTRVPGKHSFRLLVEAHKPVAGALYKDTYTPGYYCVYGFDKMRRHLVFDPYLRIDEIVEPQQVQGMGFGFTLIRRDALMSAPFRSSVFAADTYFFQDLASCGTPVYACPTFAENVKVDRDLDSLDRWYVARKRLLGDCACDRSMPR